jgi:hypothetical protein
MTDERMSDLTIKPLENGGFELSQQTGVDEADVILLHACQVRLLAERVGLLTPDPTARMSAPHVRRQRALRERLYQLHDDGYYDEIIDRCGSGLEIILNLRAIWDLADELIEDIGTPERDRGEEKPAQSNEKPPDISVTTEHPKRGRPATGAALTNSERQAKHRAKQIDLCDELDHQASAPRRRTVPPKIDEKRVLFDV